MSVATERRTGWVGWIYFAGVMMIISGVLNIINGIFAVSNPDWLIFGTLQQVFVDVGGWGWLHVVVGIVVLLSGIGVFSGNVLARTVGVIIAALSLIANFIFLPAYPLWSIVVIAVDIFVIWALTVHGREVRD